MNHWYQGDQSDMPNFMTKLRHVVASNTDQGMEVRYRPGASHTYEERFSFYWLATGWSVFAFNILSMIIVVLHMSRPNSISYEWLPHLAGTAIIDAGIAFMAIIYRFVLFPPPLYYTRSLPMEGMPSGAMFDNHGAGQRQHHPFTAASGPSDPTDSLSGMMPRPHDEAPMPPPVSNGVKRAAVKV